MICTCSGSGKTRRPFSIRVGRRTRRKKESEKRPSTHSYQRATRGNNNSRVLWCERLSQKRATQRKREENIHARERQKSLSLFHTFSLSSRHTHVTHVTRTTDPFNARTMHSHLTYFPSSVTSTSILEHTPHTRPTHSFTSAIPQKRPFLPTLTLIADLPPRVVLP